MTSQHLRRATMLAREEGKVAMEKRGVQINAQFLFFWTMSLGMKFFVLVRLLEKYFCIELFEIL
jgi:hypothetical protein